VPVPEIVHRLVDRFEEDRKTYRSSTYKEEWIRQDFIDPLFEALGWDVTNKSGVPVGPHREVIPEDAIRVRGAPKAPDYGFYVGGARKFFVEAKKPSVNLAGDISPAFQLRRYAWSAKLPLSVLTDFEEMALYDCRFEPKKEDGPRTARLNFLTYEQYPERWEEIASIFSKEAVLSGSLEKYAEETKRKRGTETVDSAFLKEIEGWRSSLARELAAHNDLNRRQLNYAVQMIIDRIVFLRMAEDRGIEEYGRLLGIIEGYGVYGRLRTLFKQADNRYNSGLFHFRPERDRKEDPDTLTPTLAIGDWLLRGIIQDLYYPESPYEFSVLPVDVLGQVYEQFLGKVIRLEDSHKAVVEEKPEVRKAGGVYYTPTYIVDYIVEHTVGTLLEGKRPGPKGGASRLKIVDPACGSGAFLIGAFQYLLDWYRDRYVEDGPDKWPNQLYQGPGGESRLTIDEKKRILTNNIYGADIDPQAVEVTKLALLLKVLEGETDETLESQLRLFAERALPDLDKNIKCGNSLIEPDFYENDQMGLLDEEVHYRINVFDWKKSFPHVFDSANPGFDAVIGNPPYIRIQAMKEFAPIEVEYYKKAYKTARRGNYDIYVVFVERGLKLLNKNGRLGYILPSKFLATDYGAALRAMLSESEIVDRIVDFGHSQVFEGSTTYTCLLFLDENQPKEIDYLKVSPGSLSGSPDRPRRVSADLLGNDSWIFADERTQTLLTTLKDSGAPLLQLPAAMSRGTSTGNDDVFCLLNANGVLTTRDGDVVEVEEELLRQPIYATDFTRNLFRPRNNERIIFPYVVSESRYELIAETELRSRWPKAYAYLRENRQRLEKRKQYKRWYGYSAPRNLNVHDHADFLVPLLADRGLFAPMPLDKSRFCVMASGGFSVSLMSAERLLSPLYVLGLVNSKLLFFNLRLISNKFRGGWITCTKQYFGTLPIRTIKYSDSDEVARHDRIVGLVERTLELHERLAEAKIQREKTVIQHQIDATDRQIDRLVYELYGLSDEEIAIVEEATVS